MNSVVSSVLIGVAAAVLLTGCGTTSASRSNSSDQPQIRAMLEKGRARDSMPEGLTIRIEAHLFNPVPADPVARAKEEARGADFDRRLDEIWELSGNQVHRVTMTENENPTGRIYRRTESRLLDVRGVCSELLAAQILNLAARQGKGIDNFAGTGYKMGTHLIEFFIDGNSVLSVGESCAAAGFAESDARTFAAIYEKLATRARHAFETRKGSEQESGHVRK